MDKCIEFVTEYEKDLPKNMHADEHIYNRLHFVLRSIFSGKLYINVRNLMTVQL